jgi:hypothetical protein
MPKLIEKMRKFLKSSKEAVKTTDAKKASNTVTTENKNKINRKKTQNEPEKKNRKNK